MEGKTLFTMQEKCLKIVDQHVIDDAYKHINNARKATFMKTFELRDVQNQIVMKSNKNVVPYNGHSFYKIDYKNELPQWLLSAYGKMMKMNNSPTRNKMKKKRAEIKL
nr:hypothetical protein [Bacteroidota bacterium]